MRRLRSVRPRVRKRRRAERLATLMAPAARVRATGAIRPRASTRLHVATRVFVARTHRSIPAARVAPHFHRHQPVNLPAPPNRRLKFIFFS